MQQVDPPPEVSDRLDWRSPRLCIPRLCRMGHWKLQDHGGYLHNSLGKAHRHNRSGDEYLTKVTLLFIPLTV